MSIRRHQQILRGQAGLSLIELVMFIVIVSVGVAGILSALDTATKTSADPLQRKQALAIAEAMLEEVTLMPFTDCDPDGFESETSCTLSEGMGPESSTGEARGSLSAPFDNINDYNGLNLTAGSTDLGNSSLVTIPAGYSAKIDVSNDAAFGPASNFADADDTLRIAVTVTYNGGADSIVLEGYRTRYAPNGMP